MLAALRAFRRRPGFVAGAALTLALGIGANVAVFSAVRAVLIDDPPYPEAASLVTLLPADHMRGTPFTGADVDRLRHLPAFSAVAGCGAPDVVPLRSNPRVQAVGIQVTPDFFRLFGIAPQLGRLLTAEDFAPGVRNAVISSEMWRTVFGGDPQVIGKAITLNRQSWTIVGVMPRVFLPPCFEVGGAAQAWIPDAAGPAPTPPVVLAVIARLAPGVSVDAAQAQVNTLTAQLAIDKGDGRYEYAYLEPLGAGRARELEPGLLLLQGVRMWSAGRSVIGLVGAWWAIRLLEATPVFRSLLFQISPHDPWTFVLVSVGALTVALVAAWLPARRVSRVDPAVVLRDN